MAFDVQAARKAGYTDDEIADFLGNQSKFDVAGARKAGYTAPEIVGFLSQAANDAKPDQGLTPLDTEQVTSARAWQGAGAGRGSPNDPRRVDVEQPKKSGSVLEGVNLGMPSVDPEANRRAMQASSSPDSVMFTAGRAKQRVDRQIELGKLAKQAGYDSVPEFLQAQADSERRKKFAEENPNIGALASGSAKAVQGAINAIPAAAGFLNKAVVDPVIGLAGAKMPDVPTAPGTEQLGRMGDEFMPAVGKLKLSDAWDKGRFGEWLAANVSAQAPQIAQSVYGVVSPGAVKAILPAMGAQATGSSFAEGDDPRVAVAKGMVEMLSEGASFGVAEKVKTVLQGLAPAAQQSVFKTIAQKSLAVGGALTAQQLAGAVEESVAQIGGNALDIYVSGKQKEIMEGVPEAAVIGAAVNTAMAAPNVLEAAKSNRPQDRAARALADTLNSGEFDRPQVETLNPNLAIQRKTQDGLINIGAAQTVDEAIAAATQATSPQDRAVDNIARILGEAPNVSQPGNIPAVDSGTPGLGALEPAIGMDAGVGTSGAAERALDAGSAGNQPDGGTVSLGDGGTAPALSPDIADTASRIRELEGAQRGEPASMWFGRRGDGYQTPEDASAALPSRQRVSPDLEWKVEQMPSGRYRLAGYDPQARQPAPAFAQNQAPGLINSAPTAINSVAKTSEIARLRQAVEDAPPITQQHIDAIKTLRAAVTKDAQDALSQGVMPVYVSNTGLTQVITPSAQRKGMYQVTRYNDTGAIGDSQYNSLEEAIRDNQIDQDRLPPEQADAHMQKLVEAEAEYQRKRSARDQNQPTREDGQAQAPAVEAPAPAGSDATGTAVPAPAGPAKLEGGGLNHKETPPEPGIYKLANGAFAKFDDGMWTRGESDPKAAMRSQMFIPGNMKPADREADQAWQFHSGFTRDAMGEPARLKPAKATNPPTQAQAGTPAEGAGESRPAPVAAPEPTAEQKIRQVFDAAPRTIGSWHKLTVEHNGKTQEFLANMKRVNKSGKRDSAIHLVNIRPGRLMAGDPLQDLAYYYKLDGKNNLVEEGIPSIATPEQLKAFGRPDPRLIPVSQRKQADEQLPGFEPGDTLERFGPPGLKGNSWVLRNKTTGETIQETSNPAIVRKLNTAKYEAVPVGRHLADVNDPTTPAYAAARNVPKNQANPNTSAEPVQKTPESEQVAAAQTGNAKDLPDNSGVVPGNSGPYGRDLTPIAQGGKPFKTLEEAKDYRKKNTNNMVVKKVGKNQYVLQDATPKQIAAWAKAGKRLGVPQTGGEGPQHAHGFLIGKGGLSKKLMADAGFDRNKRFGNRTLFADDGMTAERATELLVEAGYLREGASHNDMFNLVRKSVQTPQYTSDGWEQLAQAEQSTRFEDHLAVEQEATPEPDDVDTLFPVGDNAYTPAEIALVPKNIREEYAALMEAAEAAGVDVDAILEDAARISENQTQEQFNEYVRQALTDAIADSRRQADRRESAVQGRQDAERGGTEGSRQDAGGSGAQEEGLTAPTEADALRMGLGEFTAANADTLIAQPGGTWVLLDGRRASYQNPEYSVAFSWGNGRWSSGDTASTPKAAHAVALKRWTDRGNSPESFKQASKNLFLSGVQGPDLLAAPTPAQVLEQQDRADRAEELDQREQIQREAEGFQLQAQAPEQRSDNTGDVFGGPTAEDVARARKPGKQQEDDGTAPLFSRGRKDEPRDLIIQHNLTAENLLHAERMGGIPVPSLAITKAAQPLENFGEITLLGDADMATPRGDMKVFGADIYSPRYPNVQYKPDAASLKKIKAVLEPFRKEGEYALSELRELSDLTGDKAFVRYADSKVGGSATYAQLKSEATKLAREAGAEERIFQGFTYSGNRKYKAHTLDNVIAILKKELRGGESFNYGAGSLRAKFTPQFRTIQAIRNSKDRLITTEAFEKVKDEINKELLDLTSDMVPNGGFRSSDTGMAILEEGARIGMRRAAKEYDIELSDEQVERANEFLQKLRNLPTAYFEAKALRAMDLSEFKVAVVPDNLDADARRALEKRGVKIVTYPKGDAQARRKAIAEASADNGLMFSRAQPFYSALSKSIEGMTPKALPGAIWKDGIKGLINKGAVKEDEVEWSGIREWLDLQTGKVSKEDVLAYLDANGVQVQEVVLGAKAKYAGYDSDIAKLRDAGFTVDRNPEDASAMAFMDENGELMDAVELESLVDNGEISQDVADAASRIENAEQGDVTGTKYSQYTLPGGTAYREVLLTLPVNGAADMEALKDRIDAEYRKNGNSESYSKMLGELQALRAEAKKTYKSSHWDTPNVLAHIRLNDRTDSDGKRVLFVEEIQSDWGQAGKKKGFRGTARGLSPIEEARFQDLLEEGRRNLRGADLEEFQSLIARRDAEAENRNAPPSAPFVDKTDKWLTLALKRVITMAAQEGYDRVAFVNGEQSAERYDLSKQVRSIAWTGRGNDTEKRVTITPNSGNDIEFRVLPDGTTASSSGGLAGNEFASKRLDEVVGKDVAERIMGTPYGDMRGNGLKVGGEGMRAFYDKILPNTLKDVLKKVGGQGLETVEVGVGINTDDSEIRWTEYGDGTQRVEWDGGEREFETEDEARAFRDGLKTARSAQPGFTITPAMREKASAGLPLFRKGADQTTGLTPTQFTQALSEAFGAKVADRLQAKGVVVPLADQNSLPAHVVPYLRAGDVVFGFYDPRTDRTYAVLENLTPDMVKGLALHEVGVHYGFEAMLGADKYKQVMKRLDGMHKLGSKAVRAARAEAVKNAARPAQVPEETLAYLVQNSPELGLIKEVIAKIKAFLFREFGIGGKYLTEADLHMLAKAAVQHAARTEPGGVEVPAFMREPEFSRTPQTETKAFKDWFGDSKVVDAEGKPLVVYHGTGSDFTQFNRMAWGSADPRLAGEYAEMRGEWYGGQANVMPVYMSIRRPFDADTLDTHSSFEYPDGLSVTRFIDQIIEQSGVNESEQRELRALEKSIRAAAREEESGPSYLPEHFWYRPVMYFGEDGARQIRRVFEVAGFDGIRLTEQGAVTYGAFRPEQIKSATGNRGTFDPADPNIMFSRGTTAAQEQEEPRRPNIALRAIGYQGMDDAGSPEFSPGRLLYNMIGAGASPLLTKMNLKAASPELRQIMRKMKIDVAKAQETAAAVAKESMALTEDERQMVSDLIEKELHMLAKAAVQHAARTEPGGVEVPAFMRQNEGMANQGENGTTAEELDDALDALVRNDLEDDQVFTKPLPKADDDSLTYVTKLGGYKGVHVSVRGGALTDTGPREVFFHNDDDEPIGFARLTKNDKRATISMIAFNEDARGNGYAKAFYKYLLDEVGVAVRSDSEITEGTAALYRSLLRDYSGKVDADGRVTILPKTGAPEFSRTPQTETKAFKDWFGDSVVTESGKAGGVPLVVYHGTRADFSEFDPLQTGTASDAGWYGNGFYFTPDPLTASSYSANRDSDSIGFERMRDNSLDAGANIIPAYLRLRNPYDWRSENTRGLFQNDAGTSMRKRAELEALGHDGVLVYRDFIQIPKGGSLTDGQWQALTAASPMVKKLGRDTVTGLFQAREWTYRELEQSYGVDVAQAMLASTSRRQLMEAVVFRPEQIKSATGNRGTFDPKDPDIRFSRTNTAQTEDAEPVRPELSPWRDATGRLQFAPGAWLWDKLGTASGPILNKLQLKAATPELRRIMRQMKLDVAKAQEVAAAVAGEATKLTEDERAMVSDLIEKELKAGTIPPEHAIRLAATINTVMGKQTDELLRLGMLTKDSADRWRGQYLPRYYESKLTEKAGDLWADAMRSITRRPSAMKGIKGKHLRGRGLYETIPESQLEDYKTMGWEVRDPDYQPGLTDDGMVQVWRDFTRQERDKMGEIRDAGFRFVMGYMQTQKDIALGRMFEALATTPEMSSKNATEELSVQVPTGTAPGTEVKTYGKLAGRYVSPETLSQLSMIEEAQSEALMMYRKAMGLWKESKTVLNPVAHANNVISNITMAHFAGVSYGRVDKYLAAIRDFATKSDDVLEAKEAGLFLGTMNEAELFNTLPEELKALAQTQEGTATKIGRSAFNLLSFYLRKPMGWAYQAEDTFFRYLIYKDARGRGLSPDDAVDYAQKFIFTYDDLPKGARLIRDFGIPFFAYTYKAIPALLETALTHPERFAAPMAVIMAANAVAYAIAAGDDDDSWELKLKKYLNDPEYRKEAKAKEQLERELLPEWLKGKTALGTDKTVRLGTDELTKLPMFLDMSRMIPGGDLLDVRPNSGGIPWPQPLTPNHPLLAMTTAIFANKDTFYGKDIVNERTDTAEEAARKRMDWMWKQMTPAIAYGNYHWERWMNALAQATGKEVQWAPEWATDKAIATGIGRDGLPVQPKLAAMQTFGIKARPYDLDKAEEIQRSMTNKDVREIEAEMRSLRRLMDLGAVSDRTYDRKREAADEKKERLRDGQTVDGKPR